MSFKEGIVGYDKQTQETYENKATARRVIPVNRDGDRQIDDIVVLENIEMELKIINKHLSKINGDVYTKEDIN